MLIHWTQFNLYLKKRTKLVFGVLLVYFLLTCSLFITIIAIHEKIKKLRSPILTYDLLKFALMKSLCSKKTCANVQTILISIIFGNKS